VARRAADVAVSAVPGSVVERVTAAWAPLTRYSGRTRAGAAALASALAALTRPPRLRRLQTETASLDAIAAEIGRDDDEVGRWASAGLLGPPLRDGVWDRRAADRAALIDFALRRGTSQAEVKTAAVEGRLPLLALERVVAGHASLTGRQVAEHAGVPFELASSVWRALGLPTQDLDQPLFTRQEVHAMRVVGAMRSVFTEDDLVEAASVIGRAMAEVSAASVELFRRRVTTAFVDAGLGELEIALRLAAMSELLIPPLEPMLETALRHHLQAAVQTEAALPLEASQTPAASELELGVAFADLVGFTQISEQLSPLELGKVVARLLRRAEPELQARNARIVKSIGDAIMFTARDPVDCCRAAVDLVAAAADDGSLPPVRAGVAYGPVLRAYADFFGRTVNVASRLCDAAAPAEVLFHSAEPIDDARWRQAGLLAASGKRTRLKGIDGAIQTFSVRRA